MQVDDVKATARALVAPGKGILAADESFGTIEKRFKTIELESTEENRRSYREMLFTTEGLEGAISGVILFDETIRQTGSDGTRLAEVLSAKGMVPGIKVDKGTTSLAGFPGEKVTEGLDGLGRRLVEYKDLGAKFTKWRAVIGISEHTPTHYCINANAHAMARYAAMAQEQGFVPIVEPEVLMDGDHSIERCYDATARTLHATFRELFEAGVELEGTLLKTNMVLSGKDAPEQAGVEEVADATVRCLLEHVPPALPGVVFLSGGQSDEKATEHLNAINQHEDAGPWELSFSYGRALQAPALEAWKGDASNIAAGQEALQKRARLNGAARFGRYSPDMEREAS